MTNERQELVRFKPPMSIARLHLGQLLLPFFSILIARVGADRARGGKLVAPFPRAHGFNDHARVMALLPGWNDRIEGTAPCAPQYVDRSRGIRARRHRPNPFI